MTPRGRGSVWPGRVRSSSDVTNCSGVRATSASCCSTVGDTRRGGGVMKSGTQPAPGGWSAMTADRSTESSSGCTDASHGAW